MGNTYYSASFVSSATVDRRQQWSLLDLLVVITLAMYVAASILPQEIGVCG